MTRREKASAPSGDDVEPDNVRPFKRRTTFDGIKLASDFRPSALKWLWHPYLPVGKVIIFDGDPGRGKSMLLISLAAHIILGIPLPGTVNPKPLKPRGVVLIMAEDDWGDTVVPRLIAAIRSLKPKITDRDLNRALQRVATIDVQRDDDDQIIPLEFPRDTPLILDAIDSVNAVFVAVDPIMAFLGEDTNTGVDSSVRRALAPVKELAMDADVSIVLLRHLNKDSKAKAEYRGGGSHGGFIGLARGAWVAEYHPDRENHPGELVFCHLKSNLSKRGEALTYVIQGATFKDHRGDVGETSYIEWGESVDMDPETLMRGPDSRAKAPARRECIDAIEQLMAERDPYPAKEIQTLLADDGHKADTIKAAKRALGIRSVKDADPKTGQARAWLWTRADEDEG